ncbi:MAG: hypothetical protein HUM72_12475 [Dolichospermum sp.]|nr:hypothetical protein [Dolichospermum sp.]
MRIFFKEASNIIEVTNQINRYNSDTYLMSMGVSDALYVASDFPLNHFFVKLGSVTNSVNAALDIQYWGGNDWEDVVHINDYTNAFSNSGFIEFTPDREESWSMESTKGVGQSIIGLESITVYDKYWIKITASQSLTNNIELEWIGNKFSDDYDLYSEFPIFNDSTFLTSFESGKSTWEEQHAKAAEIIIQDLKRKNVILGKEQILERDILLPASVAKVAEIIYNAFGKDYSDQKLSAQREYERRIDLSKYMVDVNNNGITDVNDVRYSQGWLSR